MQRSFYIIVATDENSGIGKQGAMPWHLKGELKHFREVTTQTADPTKQNLLIMGRTTWQSLPEKFRPLPDRRNVVLTGRDDFQADGAHIAKNFHEAFAYANNDIEKIFVIGGQSVYEQALKLPGLAGIYKTEIQKSYDCDAFFPSIETSPKPKLLGSGEEDCVKYQFLFYPNK